MKKKMLTPRPYISYSQMILFERSPETFADVYFYGRKLPTSRNMAFGSQMADGLELDEATGDPVLDMMMIKIPKFELMDKEIYAELKNGKETIKLLAKPDTAKKDYSAFKEYKTSTRKWTQKMADESSQITFYATVIFLKTGKIPKDIELVAIGTETQLDGKIAATGAIQRIPTTRDIRQILNMLVRIKKAWGGIKKLSEETLL